MFSPLLQSIIERHGYDVIEHKALDAIARSRNCVVLFFPGDAERLGESNDVAVILPELYKTFRGAFTPLIVSAASEKALQRRYRFNAFPALVFLRRGEYLGSVQRVLDWADYLEQIRDILSREPSDPPAYKFPDGCNAQPSTHH